MAFPRPHTCGPKKSEIAADISFSCKGFSQRLDPAHRAQLGFDSLHTLEVAAAQQDRNVDGSVVVRLDGRAAIRAVRSTLGGDGPSNATRVPPAIAEASAGASRPFAEILANDPVFCAGYRPLCSRQPRTFSLGLYLDVCRTRVTWPATALRAGARRLSGEHRSQPKRSRSSGAAEHEIGEWRSCGHRTSDESLGPPSGTSTRPGEPLSEPLSVLLLASHASLGDRVLDIPDDSLNAVCVVWSPDDSRLACEAWDDSDSSRHGIYTVRSSDGGDLQRLTTAPVGMADLPGDYSPDGTQFVFKRGAEEADGLLMLVDVAGGEPRPLSTSPFEDAGRFAPDGAAVLTSARGRIVTIDLAGAVLQDFRDPDDYLFGPVWSPDGARIAFSGATGGPFADIFISLPDGTERQQVTMTPANEINLDWGKVDE